MSSEDLRQSVLYHETDPQATQAEYTEFDNVDFVINVGEGRALLKNSVRILGDLRVNSAGAGPAGTRNAAAGLGFNRNAGAHSFFQSIQVSMQNSGLVENVQNYPRLVNMLSVSSNAATDLINSDRICELRAFNDELTQLWTQGNTTYIVVGGVAEVTGPDDFDFSLKPMCALNAMSGGDLAASKSGAITLTCNMARNIDALSGATQDNGTCAYSISNLRCTYQSVLADPKAPVTGMRLIMLRVMCFPALLPSRRMFQQCARVFLFHLSILPEIPQTLLILMLWNDH